MKSTPAKIRRAFSLIEVLLAVFILGIGLIMVASVFPVGADWTRQSTENSVGETIALDALSIIQSHYSFGSLTPASFTFSFTPAPATPSPTNVQPLPNLATKIPFNERCYLFGNTKPYPVPNPNGCVYYWTALGRVNPGDYTSAGALIPAASHRYDIYILVFRKGSADQTFGGTTTSSITYPAPLNEMIGVRDLLSSTISISITSPFPVTTTYDPHLEPAVVYSTFQPGTYSNLSSSFTTDPFPLIGYIGIGATSGTVFRQGMDFSNPATPVATARPPLTTSNENVIIAPPADGTNNSPLIYVYQTTISF